MIRNLSYWVQFLFFTFYGLGFIPLTLFFSQYSKFFYSYLYAVSIFFLTILASFYNGWKISDLGLRRESWNNLLRSYGICLLVGIIFFGAYVFLFQMRLSFEPHQVIYGIFFSFFTSAIQEFAFRSYFLRLKLLLWNNKHLAVFINAFLFGLFHIVFGSINDVLLAFFFALILNYIYLSYPHLFSCIIVHGVLNFLFCKAGFFAV